MKTAVISLFVMMALAVSAEAKVKSQLVEYKDGDTVLEGYVSYDDAIKGKRPGILVVHAWMGLDDNAKKRADMLAGLGYTAFAVDIYGKGVRPKSPDEAGKLAGTYRATASCSAGGSTRATPRCSRSPRSRPSGPRRSGSASAGPPRSSSRAAVRR